MHRNVAKSLAAVALTAAGTGFIVGFRTSDAAVAADPATTTTTASGSAASAATASPSSDASSGGTGSAGAAATATTYADGTWTGAAVSEPWGRFQVQVVIGGGQITDVLLVAAPSDGHSSSINSRAVPILTQAVIAAQGAGVDMVSGATWTSRSYLTSLQSALDGASAGAAQG